MESNDAMGRRNELANNRLFTNPGSKGFGKVFGIVATNENTVRTFSIYKRTQLKPISDVRATQIQHKLKAI